MLFPPEKRKQTKQQKKLFKSDTKNKRKTMNLLTEDIFNTSLTITLSNNSMDDTSGAVAAKVASERDLEMLGPKWQVMLVILYSLTATLSLVGNAIA